MEAKYVFLLCSGLSTVFSFVSACRKIRWEGSSTNLMPMHADSLKGSIQLQSEARAVPPMRRLTISTSALATRWPNAQRHEPKCHLSPNKQTRAPTSRPPTSSPPKRQSESEAMCRAPSILRLLKDQLKPKILTKAKGPWKNYGAASLLKNRPSYSFAVVVAKDQGSTLRTMTYWFCIGAHGLTSIFRITKKPV